MKKISTLIVILISSNIPISCNNEVDCGGATSKIIEISPHIGSFLSNRFIEVERNSCEFTAINIELSNLEYIQYSESSNQKKNISLIPQLFACSPKNELLNPITSIKITSIEPLYFNNKEYKSGINLSGLFKIANENNISISNYIEDHNNRAYFFRLTGDNFTLTLNSNPDKPINHKFQFDFELKDSNNIYFETDVFQCQ